MAQPVSHLEDHLGYWLRHVSNHVSDAFARKLAAEKVSVVEWVVLRETYEVDSVAPSVLAKKIGLTRGAVTKVADRLIERSLLVRQANPDDGRAQTLALTTQGRKLVPVLAALADANDEAFFGDLPAADRKALMRILRTVVERKRLAGEPVD